MQRFSFLSPSFLGLALLGFFFTFVEVQCTQTGKTIAALNGVDLLIGKEISMDMDNPLSDFNLGGDEKQVEKKKNEGPKQKIDPDLTTILAFFAGLGGIALFSFIGKRRSKHLAVGICGAVAAISLLFLKAGLEKTINRDAGSGMNLGEKLILQVALGPGYFISLASFVFATIAGFVIMNDLPKDEPSSDEFEFGPPPPLPDFSEPRVAEIAVDEAPKPDVLKWLQENPDKTINDYNALWQPKS